MPEKGTSCGPDWQTAMATPASGLRLWAAILPPVWCVGWHHSLQAWLVCETEGEEAHTAPLS